jgi:YHS domain-containing protein
LPELPPEPDLTRPPPPPAEKTPPKEPKKATDAPKPEGTTPPPKPKESAGVPSNRTPQWGDWREDRPPSVTAVPSVSPAGNLARQAAAVATGREPWAGGVVLPAGRLEPERNAALPGAYRADSIASAPPDWQASRVEPAAYATAEPTAVPTVALGGYCPVELARNGRWVPGDLRWTVVHEGRIYRLSGAQQRQDFLANPAGFAPVNSGNDAVLLVDQNRTVAGQPAYCATYDGRLYMFSSADTQARFNSNPQRYAAGK